VSQEEIEERKNIAQRLLDVEVRRLDLIEEERDVVWAALQYYKSSLENYDLDFGEHYRGENQQ